MSLQAIESGLLPGDILDDIPGKYVDGTIICEVSNGSLTILLTIGKIDSNIWYSSLFLLNY